MKFLIRILLLSVFAFSCGKVKKIDIEKINFAPEDTWFVEPNPTQTADSIIMYNARDTITPSGDSIYIITTKFDKRIIDNIIAREKIQNNPYPLKFTITGNAYRVQKKSSFTINVYDTSGIEYKKLIDTEFSPGEYKVNFSIYTTLPGGRYYLEIILNDNKQFKRLAVG